MLIRAHHLNIDGRIGLVQDVEPEQPNGVVLLLVHTAGQSGVQWRSTLAPLSARGYRVLVPDLPGHGHSEPASSGAVTDLREYTDWLVAVLDALAIDRVVIVGCSIGGKISQDLAGRHPDRVSGGIAMCAEPGPGRVQLKPLYRELEDSAAPSRSDRTFMGTLAVIGSAVDPARGELIARMHCREDPLVSTSDLIGWGTLDIRPMLAGITCPFLFVAGEDDVWVDANAVASAAAVVPGAEFILIEQHGHYPMEEIVDFADVLHGWLEKLNVAVA
jgi:pimeloyl-ACP methyl ester carboxylesterase